MPMAIGSAIMGGTALASSLIQSNAISDAAHLQGQAMQDSLQENRRQYDINREDLRPYREAGYQSLDELLSQMGLGPNATGELSHNFTLDDFWKDPVVVAGYQSGLDQGIKGINRGAPLTSGSDSGATLKALLRFGTDYTSQKGNESFNRFEGQRGNAYNRLAAMAGIGQTAVNTGVNAGTTIAGNNAALMSANGNAQGAAAIAQGQTWGNGINSVANWWNQQNTLNQFNGMRQYSMGNPAFSASGGYYPTVQPSVPGQFNPGTYG